MKLIPIIGLEIHVQLATKSKMFCSCANAEATEPNTNICEICTGQPGTLPVANQQAIDYCLKAGLALSCQINKQSKFDRKNYFYPDLPKNYQISQYDLPFCHSGEVVVSGARVGITRIHLEEDTAKLTHAKDNKSSLVDFNRGGVPLMELVTDPDLTDAAQAKAFCQELQHIFRWISIASADMEKGQMRCEGNISLQPEGSFTIDGPEVKFKKDAKPNPKVELKNINSFRFIERALAYEIKRQAKAIEAGEEMAQETRGWDDNKSLTFHQRTKEDAHDYRYFPEPDIPPIDISDDKLREIEISIPELPATKAKRFQEQYLLAPEHARQIAYNEPLADFAEQVLSEFRAWLGQLEEFGGMDAEEIWAKAGKKAAKLAGGWLLKIADSPIDKLKVTPENFAEFLSLVYGRKVNSSAAETLLGKMMASGADPSNIMEEEDLGQMEDAGQMEDVVAKVIAANPDQVQELKGGKENVIMFLVGKVMKETGGKADPAQAQELIKKLTK